MHYYCLQRSCEGYVFTGVSLFTGGWYPSMPCRWYPSMPCSRSRGWYPSMPCRCYPSMPCSRSPGGSLLWGEGYLLWGGACSQGVTAPGECGGDPPASRRLLMRTVRILLECILVEKRISQSPLL